MPPAHRAAAATRPITDSIATPAALAVGVVVLAGLATCAPDGVGHLPALAEALFQAWPAAIWIASAAGLGRAISLAARWPALSCWPAAAAVGACALAGLDAAAGWAGWLSGTASVVWAWVLMLPGLCMLAAALLRRESKADEELRAPWPWWCPVALALALPALAVAAASEPGVLWSTEFGAYDALSYHLTLPQEWHAGDGIATLHHSAYSALPSWMEAAYLHIRALGGGITVGGSSWFVSAQMLHAGLATVAALCAGNAARSAVERGESGSVRAVAAAVACLVVVGLPWTAVTGSLAYSESLVLCALAAAMCVLMRSASVGALSRPHLLALACCAAAAFGAKPSSALLVGLPVALAALPLWRDRTAGIRIGECLLCVAAAAALLAPWWMRNWLATGNPLFPFAASALGAGWWTDEQAARFAAAHGAGTAVSWWSAPWHQWIAFGWGAAPEDGGAWRALWSVAPIASLAAVAWAVVVAVRTRAISSPATLCALVVTVQVAAWWVGTHGQSRFLLPTIIPASVLIACALCSTGMARHGAMLAPIAIAWCAQPALAFLRDGPDPRMAALWIGAAQDLAGIGPAGSPSVSMPPASPPANLVQAVNALDAATARVASVGLSATARIRPDVALDWCSVWDRGAIAQALHATSGDGRAAARLLLAEGWTHVAVDTVMLDVWARSMWRDPVLSEDAVSGLLQGQPVVWAGRQGILVELVVEVTP
jgi:hypothetical protein